MINRFQPIYASKKTCLKNSSSSIVSLPLQHLPNVDLSASNFWPLLNFLMFYRCMNRFRLKRDGGGCWKKISYKDYKKKIKEVNVHQEHETRLQIVFFCLIKKIILASILTHIYICTYLILHSENIALPICAYKYWKDGKSRKNIADSARLKAMDIFESN